MSWHIALESESGEALAVQRFHEGGTLAVGGSDEPSLNVTYNYSDVTHLVDFHFRDSLAGKKASGTIAELERVVKRLGTRQFSDYWAPTPGNAGHAANILLGWAREHPDAVWRVS